MSEITVQNNVESLLINQLLNEINTISSSYIRVSNATGENFNLFSLLNVETDEVGTHSRFIAELLNRNGSHGQGCIFLNKFLELMEIEEFEPKVSSVYVEYFIGKKNVDVTTGGRIDILIRDNKGRSIVIENKIYALEQKNQLQRYDAAIPNSNILFLTLFGDISSQEQSKSLSYKSISYESHILKWMEECKKESVNLPVLRESIGQYIDLIKKLTYQNLNTKMNTDIVDRILKDAESLNAVGALVKTKNEVRKRIIKEDLIPLINYIPILFPELKTDMDESSLLNGTGQWLAFCFVSEELKSLNLKISFSFNQKSGYNNLIFGFSCFQVEVRDNFDYKNVQLRFSECFGGMRETTYWPCWKSYSGYSNWDDFEILEKIKFGDFKNDFVDKISKMIKIVESVTAIPIP